MFLGLDLGTTTIKAILYDPTTGRIAGPWSRPTPVTYLGPGLSEHDPDAFWAAVVACLRDAADAATDRGREVVGLAIASFAEAGLPLDAAGRPLYPIIAWHDRRTEAQAAWWDTQLSSPDLHAITGQMVSPSFGVNKWLWLAAHRPDVTAQTAIWLSAADYILYRLTGEYATDYSQASRTLLLDQRTRAWSAEMLLRAGLRVDQLPRPHPAGTLIGPLTRAAAQATGLPAGLHCALGGHDHLCAALAVGGYHPGTVVDSSGTAQAVVMTLPSFRTAPAIAAGGYSCYAHVAPGCYAFKGGLKSTGSAVEWLARQLAAPDATGALPYAVLQAEAAAGVGLRRGPLWLPHLLGSGTPQGDRHSLAALVGVRLEHERGDLFRGLLESLACWLRHNLEVMAGLTGQPAGQVIALGGATRLPLLTQLKADLLNAPVSVPDLPEAAATGAALLAGMAVGAFPDVSEAVASLRYGQTVIEPDAGRVSWYDELFHEAYLPLYEALRQVNHVLDRS
jgi:xylulokinase